MSGFWIEYRKQQEAAIAARPAGSATARACACGCGKPVVARDPRGRKRRYRIECAGEIERAGKRAAERRRAARKAGVAMATEDR